MKKNKIRSRENKKIVVIIEKPNNPQGLAFIMHGLGGNKDQPHTAQTESKEPLT